MAQSLGPPRGPSGTFSDAPANAQFTIESSHSQMVQRIERGGFSADYPVAYSVGSGAHAIGYLIQMRDHLFQSPLGYYRGRGWGMAPGYENSNKVDFYRPVTPECLLCHAGEPRPVPGTVNTYQNPPFQAEAITCERCHGPVEAHLRDPAPGSIINPAKLPPRARDSICEQCHLQGEARITNPGKSFSDFRPGEDLEAAFAVYIFALTRSPAHPAALKVISQSQQLALSMCARMSNGRLWCGTCHDPHRQPANPVAYFRARCLSCHGAALLKTHPKPDGNCIACHMPRLPVVNGNHTIFTDHRIAIYTPQEIARHAPSQPTLAGDLSLVPWHRPPAAFAQRDLALADIQAGQKLKSLPLVNQGFRLLLECASNFPNDPAVLSTLGQMFYESGEYTDAEAAYARAIRLEPDVAMNYLQAGLVSEAAHDNIKAVQYFDSALQLDPLLPQPYWELAQIYLEDHDPAMARQTFERYLKTFPEDIEARMAAAQSP
ncbi:MAG: tetratricopeptide repeat protein [Terriglobia bacterium]